MSIPVLALDIMIWLLATLPELLLLRLTSPTGWKAVNECSPVLIFLDHSLLPFILFPSFLKSLPLNSVDALFRWFFLVLLQLFLLCYLLHFSLPPLTTLQIWMFPQAFICNFHLYSRASPTSVSGVGIIGVPKISILWGCGSNLACLSRCAGHTVLFLSVPSRDSTFRTLPQGIPSSFLVSLPPHHDGSRT